MTDLGESKTKRILRVLAVGIVLLIGGCGQEEKKPEIKSLFVPVDREQIKAIEVAEKKAVELKVKLEEKDLMIKKDGADYTVMFWPKPNSSGLRPLGGSIYITVRGTSGEVTKVVYGQ